MAQTRNTGTDRTLTEKLEDKGLEAGNSLVKRESFWLLVGSGVLAVAGFLPEHVQSILPLVDPKYANWIKLASIVCVIASQAFAQQRVSRVDRNTEKVAEQVEKAALKPRGRLE